MSEERRYDEDEIARIFEDATRTSVDVARRRGSGGLTLAEIQEIGEEVGIPGRDVARAAARLDVQGDGVQRRVGLPVGVSRVVDLPRPLTDHEWERLVARLRLTFDAPGRVWSDGGLRQWRNGNLQAHVEATERGYQLRLQTFKGSLRPLAAIGGTMLGFSLISVLVALIGAGQIDVGSALTLAFTGLGVLAFGVVGLPSWAKLRDRQMKEIAATAMDWTALPPAEAESGDSE